MCFVLNAWLRAAEAKRRLRHPLPLICFAAQAPARCAGEGYWGRGTRSRESICVLCVHLRLLRLNARLRAADTGRRSLLPRCAGEVYGVVSPNQGLRVLLMMAG